MSKINVIRIFIIYIFISNGTLFLSNYFLFTSDFFHNTFSEQLTFQQIENIVDTSKEWQWLGYVISPIIILLKIFVITGCLSLGIYFITNSFSFKPLFRITLLSEFVFLIPPILKVFWFSIFSKDFDLVGIQLFSPFSALSIFNEAAVQQNQPWLVYPLQTLNLFEVAYWFLLAKGVSEVIKKDFTKSFELVLASYGTGLVLWIVTIMFLTVTYGV